MLTRSSLLVAALLALLPPLAQSLATGCAERPVRPLVPCTHSGVVNEVDITQVNQVDLLFLVDNSGSMKEEQEALISEIPRMVTILATGELPDGSTFEPVASLRVGVITSDMGVGGIDIPAYAMCSTALGDDGVLLTEHRGTRTDCEDAYPAFLEFASATGVADDFAGQVRCLANTGSAGCSFEQQLEAVLKALTPSTSPITFPQTRGGAEIRNTVGHGDTENAIVRGDGTRESFVRPDSLLAIVVITDEDDCSSADLDLYDIAGNNVVYPVPTYRDPDGVVVRAATRQCATYRDAQHPISRYVDGLLALRPGAEGRLIFAVIGGVAPEVLAANSEEVLETDVPLLVHDYAGMLAHPSMQEVANAIGSELVPGCVRPNPEAPTNPVGQNEAFPPRRLIRVAQGLDDAGAAGVVASICEAVDSEHGDYRADFAPAIDAIVAAIASKIPTSCLPRPLIRNGLGKVPCSVLEVLPAGTTCAEHAGRGRNARAVSVTEDGREVCGVEQVAPTLEQRDTGMDPIDPGWFYDDYSSRVEEDCATERRQQIRFTIGAEPTLGARFRLECLTPVAPPESVVDIGTSCESNAARCTLTGTDLARLRSQYDRPNAELRCDDYSNTCRLTCATGADCPGGYICFDADAGNLGSAPYCISPTCDL